MGRGGVRHRRLVAVLACLVLTGCAGDPAAPPPDTTPAVAPTVPSTTTSVAVTSTTAVAVPVVRSLPLGDGKRSSTPDVGSVFACQTAFGPAGGAFRDGPWIRDDGTWDPTAKLHVQGAVAWPQSEFDVSVDGPTRVVTTNG